MSAKASRPWWPRASSALHRRGRSAARAWSHTSRSPVLATCASAASATRRARAPSSFAPGVGRRPAARCRSCCPPSARTLTTSCNMEIINPVPDDDGGDGTIPKTRKSKSPGADDLDAGWLSQCIRRGGKKSKPLPVLANALIGVRAVWPDAIAYDEMLCAPTLMQPLQGENDFTPRPLTDVDVGIMQDRLQHLGLK